MTNTTKQSIAAILDQIAATSSKNEKIALLTAQHDNKLFKEVLVAAFEPKINYYIKKIPTAVGKQNPDYHLHHALLDLEEFSKRHRTGNDAIEYLASILGTLDVEDASVLAKIIKRDLRAGFSEDTVNKVWPGLISSYPCMLCYPSKPNHLKKMHWPAIFQLKSDGMRFSAEVEDGIVSFLSRNGLPIDLMGRLEDICLKAAGSKNVVIDGELLMRRNGKILPRKEGNGFLQRGIKGTMTEEIADDAIMSVWDIIPLVDFRAGKCAIKYEDRFTLLAAGVTRAKSDKMILIEHTYVKNIDEVQVLFEKYLEMDLEGGILKDLSVGWKDHRSSSQLKFKAEKECDLEIIGSIEGEGKYKGMLGAWLCTSADMKIAVKVAGFTDDQRRDFWNRSAEMGGKIVSVMFNEAITDKKKPGVYSLFLPRMIEVRLDKSKANTLKEILDL